MGRAGGRGRAAWEARPRWRITAGDDIALGPGKRDLLRAIEATGSISGAAAALGMSYRRAWMLMDEMNGCFARPLVETSRWRRGGAALTPAGVRALGLYDRIEAKSLRAAGEDLARLRRMLR